MVPPIIPIEKLQLPLNSLYHYFPYDSFETGPVANEFILRHIDKPIPIKHVGELRSFDGAPRLNPMPVISKIRKFHNTNRRFRLVPGGIDKIGNPQMLPVVSYALIPQRYRYMRALMGKYYKTRNLTKTVQ